MKNDLDIYSGYKIFLKIFIYQFNKILSGVIEVELSRDRYYEVVVLYIEEQEIGDDMLVLCYNWGDFEGYDE